MSLTASFVLNNETVLCRYIDEGWLPIQVAMPLTFINNDGAHQTYQLGCVPLLVSNETAKATKTIETDQLDESAPISATYAVTVCYANSQHIVFPTPTVEVSADAVSGSSTDEPIALGSVALVAYRQLIPYLPIELACQLSQAIQLLRWQADTRFCSRCGEPVTAASRGERAMVCTNCRLRQYPRVQPCVITAITRPNPLTGEMQILLAHHHRYGRQTPPLQYGLIAGFVEVGESLEHAVMREVGEEVGIKVTDIDYVSSQPWPFPSNLMLGFRACYAGGDIVLQEDELSHADFFDITNLPKIPFKGSIAYHLIEQIAHEQGIIL